MTGGVFATGGVTRPWTDADGDFHPDCDLPANAANFTGGDVLGRYPTRASARTC